MTRAKRDRDRERVDAAITRAIRARYAHDPTRAEREVARYEAFIASYRERLGAEHGLSRSDLRRLQHAASHWSGWAGAYARAKLKQVEHGLTGAEGEAPVNLSLSHRGQPVKAGSIEGGGLQQ